MLIVRDRIPMFIRDLIRNKKNYSLSSCLPICLFIDISLQNIHMYFTKYPCIYVDTYKYLKK